MSQEAKSNAGRQSAWGTVSLVIFLAAAAYFLFTEHRAHLWIALPLLGVCFAVIVLFWHTVVGTTRTLQGRHTAARKDNSDES